MTAVPAPPVVEVFADVWCPFAHVGIARWVRRREELGRHDVRLRVRAWPLELINGQPLSAGHVRDEVRDLREQVDVQGLFDGIDGGTFPTSTLGALALTALAGDDSPATGEAVALELRRRLFVDGQDIGRPDVLAEVAAAAGLRFDPSAPDLAAVEREWALGTARGVVGSPHFFVGSHSVFCPSLAIHRDRADHLAIADTDERFEELVERSLGAISRSVTNT